MKNLSSRDKPFTAHDWLLQEQQRLADIVGEPVFITIRVIYDGSIEVDIDTFVGRHGTASGETLPEALQAAVETLLELDKVTGLMPL